MAEVRCDVGSCSARLIVGIVVVVVACYPRSFDLAEVEWMNDPGLRLIICAPGALLVVNALWHLIKRTPALRATDDGVSLHGSPLIRWAEVAKVFAIQLKTTDDDVDEKERLAVGFTFRSRRSIVRLPIMKWPMMLVFREYKVSLDHVIDRPEPLARELEALRRADAVSLRSRSGQ